MVTSSRTWLHKFRRQRFPNSYFSRTPRVESVRIYVSEYEVQSCRKAKNLWMQSMKKMMIMILRYFLVLMMIGGRVGVRSDFTEDKKECQDQVKNLSSCIRFITEQDKLPSPICCLNLGENYDQKRRCLCMAVSDRNDPGFGFKVNATLALALPYICHIPANVTRCIDFLHIDPQSPEAEIFTKSYDNIFGNSSSLTTSDNSTYSSSTTPSSSSRDHVKRWLNLGMVGASVWLLITSTISVM